MIRLRALRWLLAASVALNAGLAVILLDDYQFRSYGLLHPAFSLLSDEDSQVFKFRYSRNHEPLRAQILASHREFEQGRAVLYFEMLNNGGWFGIKEDERMLPGSLRKVSLLAATLKAAEMGALRLDEVVEIREHHLDAALGLKNAVGPLAAGGAGQKPTVRKLIEVIAIHSDNTGTAALLERVGYEGYADALFAMGMSWRTWRENFESKRMLDFPSSAYEYAQAFRSLYFSSYLRPRNSQELLSLLSRSSQSDGLRAGVPSPVLVAHKTGDWRYGDYHHDCGIVYQPKRPYVLCIMTRGLDRNAANDLITGVSREVYAYVETVRETRSGE